MKSLNINTYTDEIDIKNGYLFSSKIDLKSQHISPKSTTINCTLNADWVQFKAECINKNCLTDFTLLSDDKLLVERAIKNNDPNYLKKYIVSFRGIHVLDLFSSPTNLAMNSSVVSVKLANHILYETSFDTLIDTLLEKLRLRFIKMTKLAIAADSPNYFVIMDLCRRFLRTKTIHIGNDNLSINGKGFNKQNLSWSTYHIGSRRYKKFGRLYCKSSDPEMKNKKYIESFWESNGLQSDKPIYRFEIELGSRHLDKYALNLQSIGQIEVLKSVFRSEVEPWLNFYYIKRSVAKKFKRKDIQLKHSKKYELFSWNEFPEKLTRVKTSSDTINSNIAKGAISFAFKEMRSDIKALSGSTFQYVGNISEKYRIDKFTLGKYKAIFTGIDEQHYSEMLDALYETLETTGSSPINTFGGFG